VGGLQYRGSAKKNSGSVLKKPNTKKKKIYIYIYIHCGRSPVGGEGGGGLF